MVIHNQAFYGTDFNAQLNLVSVGNNDFIVYKLMDKGASDMSFLPEPRMSLAEQIKTLRQIATKILEQLEEIDAKSV